MYPHNPPPTKHVYGRAVETVVFDPLSSENPSEILFVRVSITAYKLRGVSIRSFFGGGRGIMKI